MTITLMRRRKPSTRSGTDESSPTQVPLVLPMVTMTAQPDDTLGVTVDGRPFPPPVYLQRWVRHSFAQIINEVIEQRNSPVRVVIHEQDGSVYTDIVTQPIRDGLTSEPGEEPTPVKAKPSIKQPARLLSVRGDEGFGPGEQVAIAVIVRHTSAQSEGSARSLIEQGLLDLSPTREVVLLGRVSGTCVIGQPG